ncbi:MAG: hypothetical protein ACR2K1_02265 [Saprospiraceae bacterium]
MNTTQTALLDQLETDLRMLLEHLRREIVPLDNTALAQRAAPRSWTMLEGLAHLNALLDYYLPRLELARHKALARRWTPVTPLRYTGRGRRMLRKADPGNPRRYRSAKAFDFSGRSLDRSEIKSCIIQLERLLRQVQIYRGVDLNRPAIRKAKTWFGSYTPGNLMAWLVVLGKRVIIRPAP